MSGARGCPLSTKTILDQLKFLEEGVKNKKLPWNVKGGILETIKNVLSVLEGKKFTAEELCVALRSGAHIDYDFMADSNFGIVRALLAVNDNSKLDPEMLVFPAVMLVYLTLQDLSSEKGFIKNAAASVTHQATNLWQGLKNELSELGTGYLNSESEDNELDTASPDLSFSFRH